LKEFDKPIPKEQLDILEKNRSNLFPWRGQFSPQLIETILEAYCLPNSVILDPFVGSGTVLLEAGRRGLEAYGFEINPAAFILSKTYEFINDSHRRKSMQILRELIDREFPFRIFAADEPVQDLEQRFNKIRGELNKKEAQLFDALIILLDVENYIITNELIQSKFANLVGAIAGFPESQKSLKVGLSDARSIPIQKDSIDFIVTSPPYINVFNYHQNYRKSAEMLGWDLLKIAKSEIGSNRANRSNRFYTVIQYCLDMADTLMELSRVGKYEARIVLVVGHQSNVLGVPFYNADIIERIAIKTHLFDRVFRQKREFKNKFGKVIREDLINLINLKNESRIDRKEIETVARKVAFDVLTDSLPSVSSKNRQLLESAIGKVHDIGKTPILDRKFYRD